MAITTDESHRFPRRKHAAGETTVRDRIEEPAGVDAIGIIHDHDIEMCQVGVTHFAFKNISTFDHGDGGTRVCDDTNSPTGLGHETGDEPQHRASPAASRPRHETMPPRS